jgi:hypothetical protein
VACQQLAVEFLEPGQSQVTLGEVEGLKVSNPITIEDVEYDDWKLNRDTFG